MLEFRGINLKINVVDRVMHLGRAMMMMLMIMKRYLGRHGHEVDRVVGDQLENFIFENRCVYQKQIDQCYPIKHVKNFYIDFSIFTSKASHQLVYHTLSQLKCTKFNINTSEALFSML